ncbi:MAG: tRNA (5-methylaminomethyl-2-thiouridine)(34)-methyltransferase MnmD [Bacteroidia bacterium]
MESPIHRILTLTHDGSSTIYLPALHEHYHSIHGAWQESLHVYINTGLKALPPLQEVHILEMGFGTGLNALQSWEHALQNNIRIFYTTIEAYPLTEEDWALLNYPQFSKNEGAEERMHQLHQAEWGNWQTLSPNFSLLKHSATIQEIELTSGYDVVFYDAFAPRVQPELWTEKIFRKISSYMKPGGILVTYCAAGAVKKNLIAAGFSIFAMPGPPGKREITKALKPV